MCTCVCSTLYVYMHMLHPLCVSVCRPVLPAKRVLKTQTKTLWSIKDAEIRISARTIVGVHKWENSEITGFILRHGCNP